MTARSSVSKPDLIPSTASATVGLGKASAWFQSVTGARLCKFVVGKDVAHALTCAFAPQRDCDALSTSLQRLRVSADSLEDIRARLGPFGDEIAPLPRSDIEGAGFRHCERCQPGERFGLQPLLPFAFAEIKPFRRQRLVGWRHSLLQGFAARLVVVGNLRETLMRGVFDKMLQRQRCAGQVVEDRFKLVVEQRQPMLHPR